MALTHDDKKWMSRSFATKRDLEGFATKADIGRFATKDDLKATESNLKGELQKYATKDDLATFPTKLDLKEELTNFATKANLETSLQAAEKRIVTSIERTVLALEANVTGRIAHLELVTANKHRS